MERDGRRAKGQRRRGVRGGGRAPLSPRWDPPLTPRWAPPLGPPAEPLLGAPAGPPCPPILSRAGAPPRPGRTIVVALGAVDRDVVLKR
eukprot:361271-Chlamydomonas_euryale.AAC.9